MDCLKWQISMDKCNFLQKVISPNIIDTEFFWPIGPRVPRQIVFGHYTTPVDAKCEQMSVLFDSIHWYRFEAFNIIDVVKLGYPH